ncbi:MAG: histidinol dehydrogenase [Pontimonas sp.]|nr:histidinol dehydrogenase [Pontimonas sp.]
MIRIEDLRGVALTAANAHSFVPRVSLGAAEVDATVSDLMAEVKKDGSSALRRQALAFDGVAVDDLRVSSTALKGALSGLDKKVKSALEESIRRVRAASEDAVPQSTTTTYNAGGSVTTRYVPVDRAGVYVPGGKAVYPSSVVMNVVAAQAAGVPDIVLVSPPQQDFGGLPHPTILAAAELLGITEVYAVGGAGAIAALAWGVPDIALASVSVITGPGNRYVAAAKKQVRGQVGIDSEAGPTEIGILADDTAHPEFIAADMVSQAEHDELASAVLITTSMELAKRVEASLTRQVAQTHHSERVTTSLSGEQSAILVVDRLDQAVDLVNALAAEHLEIMVESPDDVVGDIRHAGAIFIGDYTPVSAGDYLAGSNHVLPTAGGARFTSGLSPLTFLRSQQVVEYDKGALEHVADSIVALAQAENLPAHGDAVTTRFLEPGEL